MPLKSLSLDHWSPLLYAIKLSLLGCIISFHMCLFTRSCTPRCSWELILGLEDWRDLVRSIFWQAYLLVVLSVLDNFMCQPGGHFLKRFYFFLERGGRREEKRERNIDVRGKHQLVASCTYPDWGPNPQPRHVPWLGMEPVTFCFVGWCPTNWSMMVRAEGHFWMRLTFKSLSKQIALHSVGVPRPISWRP